MEPMTRAQLLKVSESGQRMPGPSWRRVDCMVPGIGVETWAALLEMGGPTPRYGFEDIDPSLAGAGHPPFFKEEPAAMDWLVAAINAAPIAVDVRAALDRIAAAEAAKSEAKRLEELARARAIVESAERRLAQTEGS